MQPALFYTAFIDHVWLAVWSLPPQNTHAELVHFSWRLPLSALPLTTKHCSGEFCPNALDGVGVGAEGAVAELVGNPGWPGQMVFVSPKVGGVISCRRPA